MSPGTGDMGSATVNSWSNILSKRTVMNGPGIYSIKLNPEGALKKRLLWGWKIN